MKTTGKAVGEGVVEVAKKLWARLRPKVEEEPMAAGAAREVAKAPEDAAAQGALTLQLRKILEADASLAAELAKLVAAAGPRETYFAQLHGSGAIAQGKGNVVAGAGGMAVGRDWTGDEPTPSPDRGGSAR